MSDCGPGLTDDQWEKIRQIVHDDALRAREAASFLPLYGPLPGSTVTVPQDRLSFEPLPDGLSGEASPSAATGATQQYMRVDDYDQLRIATVAVNVYLKNHMIADPELAAASVLFSRAAKIVARVEDSIIFNGWPSNLQHVRPVYTITGANSYDGLVSHARESSPQIDDANPGVFGPDVFRAVVSAIADLERRGYYKPYACVLANDLFTEINRPIQNSMVLPAESIPPFLDGPLLRSSSLQLGKGLVISLQGNPVEIVVPNDISVRYLQGMLDGQHAFRIAQRFVLRVKDWDAVALIQRKAPPSGIAGDA
ncbi:family 1 encapsulin nanocompartment shell protein [Methylocapsa polymorpha]|uniref:Family 1 encapsulin nanocompartment shell protein n=1 Tax=Methylocapsa polymorpha TaxID=3080828 RepID=A0ABZ0HWD7_9HYPH|nr:family 1 encapsulin nanocompartment shell protein [Methylocapsa sp. RX1]